MSCCFFFSLEIWLDLFQNSIKEINCLFLFCLQCADEQQQKNKKKKKKTKLFSKICITYKYNKYP